MQRRNFDSLKDAILLCVFIHVMVFTWSLTGGMFFFLGSDIGNAIVFAFWATLGSLVFSLPGFVLLDRLPPSYGADIALAYLMAGGMTGAVLVFVSGCAGLYNRIVLSSQGLPAMMLMTPQEAARMLILVSVGVAFIALSVTLFLSVQGRRRLYR